MRKRVKKRRLTLAGWMAIGLTGSVAAGVWASPVTAVRTVIVEGAGEPEREAVADAVQTLKGVPCLRVDSSLVEGRVMGLPWIRSAELRRTPFGTARLKIERRVMVARLDGVAGVGLSEDGTICRTPDPLDRLPVLRVPLDGPGTGPTFSPFAARPYGALVRLAKEAPSLGGEKPVRIEVDRGGGICLNIGVGRVLLGASDGLDEKLETLRKRMRAFPTELETVAELNLVAPGQPSIVPRSPVPPDGAPGETPPP